MTRINLIKYGFVRCPSADFTDDGSRFTCYRVGNGVRVSKLVADGQVYLSAASDCNKGTLPYEVYSKLPHYKDSSWKWNGVSMATLTEQDIIDFYDACIAYEKEYEEAEAAIVYPTLEELQKKATELYVATMADVKAINSLFNHYAFDAASKFSSYEWKTCQEYIRNLLGELNRLDPEQYPQKIVNTVASFGFMNRVYKESYYSTYIKELFAKHCMK